MRRACLASVLLIAGCFDFGYEVPEVAEVDAPPAQGGVDGGAGPDGGGGACVEGVVPPTSSGPQVAIITLNVNPRILEVRAGDTVTWTNTDSDDHTVTAGAPGAEQPPAQGGFDSGTLAPGARWAYRFCSVRTAIYFCKTHPQQMNGFRVVVRE